VDADAGAEPGEKPVHRAAEFAVADQPDLGARQEPRLPVAVEPPDLAPLAEGEVGVRDAAEQVEREAEPISATGSAKTCAVVTTWMPRSKRRG
jgi:hypothetical protein